MKEQFLRKKTQVATPVFKKGFFKKRGEFQLSLLYIIIVAD